MGAAPLVGLAYTSQAVGLVRDYDAVFDYVEVPFEQLVHDPSTRKLCGEVPLVLHCASLSLAGFVPPPPATLAAVRRTATDIGSPWVGEHLAFLTAAPLASFGDPIPTGVHDVGYTVAPSFNEETLSRVLSSVHRVTDAVDLPLIVENPPVYFAMPDSDLTPSDFLAALCEECEVGLLLDLTHLYVACTNLGLNPFAALDTLPLARVVEVHVSGASQRNSTMWDDHSVPVPDVVFDLLHAVLARTAPCAVTIELNWRSGFPAQTVIDTATRIRSLIVDSVVRDHP